MPSGGAGDTAIGRNLGWTVQSEISINPLNYKCTSWPGLSAPPMISAAPMTCGAVAAAAPAATAILGPPDKPGDDDQEREMIESSA
jgi:hypothetical protein